MDKIDVDVHKDRKTLIPSTNSVQFTQTKFLQGKQLELLHEECHIRDEVTSIQAWLLPHMKIMQRNPQTRKYLNQNQHLLIVDKMMNLVAKIEIDKHVLESFKTNQNNTMAISIILYHPFLTDFDILLEPQLNIISRSN